MRTSEINFLWMMGIFLFGLLNIFPTQISVFDNYIIPIIEDDVQPGEYFYWEINGLIGTFRILIIVGTLIELVAALKYAKRYNIYGFRDTFYTRV